MNEGSLFWRMARGAFYLFGAGLIIFLQQMPYSFLGEVYAFQNGLFVWTAAFTHRRPNSANLVMVFLVCVFYALQIDEGMALGAMMLFAIAIMIKRVRLFNINNTFFMEWFVTTAIYLGLLISQQMLLFFTLTPHYNIRQVAWLTLTFFVFYPILNFIIVALVGSRKGSDEL